MRRGVSRSAFSKLIWIHLRHVFRIPCQLVEMNSKVRENRIFEHNLFFSKQVKSSKSCRFGKKNIFPNYPIKSSTRGYGHVEERLVNVLFLTTK